MLQRYSDFSQDFSEIKSVLIFRINPLREFCRNQKFKAGNTWKTNENTSRKGVFQFRWERSDKADNSEPPVFYVVS